MQAKGMTQLNAIRYTLYAEVSDALA
jgi:hypothetical protein